MKQLGKIGFLGLLAAALVSAQGHGFRGQEHGFGFAAMGPWGGTPVTGAPYSAVEVRSFTQTLASGNQIQRQDQTKVWRDSQGRVRTETVAGAESNGRAFVTIFDPVAGRVVRLDAERQVAMVMQVKPHGAQDSPRAHHAPAGQSEAAKEDLGSTTVNGRQAMATRTTRTIPAGTIGNQQPIVATRTVWMSPDLKVPLQIVSDDPRWGTSTVTLTNIAQTEPDPALFQIPSGYAVKTGPMGHGPHSEQ